MAEGIEIEGLEECIKQLEEVLPKEARNLARSAVQGVAMQVRNEMRKKAPRRTGRLRRSIKAKRNRPHYDQVSSDVFVDNKAFYWRFVEYGTQKEAAHPFVQPTVEEIGPKIPDLFREQMGIKLERLMVRKANKINKK